VSRNADAKTALRNICSKDKVMNNVPYANRIIAFIDILGFRELITSISINHELHNRINYALHRIKTVNPQQFPSSKFQDIEVSTFSDSIVISSAGKNIFAVIWASGWLQADLLYAGILTRGAVSRGLLHHQDGILYGEGVLSAYELEQKASFYPRIIISNELLFQYKILLKDWIEKDHDELCFINPFKFNAVAGGATDLAADGYDPREIYFRGVRVHLIERLGSSPKEEHLSKINWMIKRFNEAATAFNKSFSGQIDLIDSSDTYA
jgi:hypothetical protein